MLVKLKELLENKSLFIENEIKSLCDSCCTSINFKVLDWDEITARICKTLELNSTLSSVDGIFFVDDDSLYFVELTSYKNFIARENIEDRFENCHIFISKQLPEIERKITDTIFCLLLFCGTNGIDKDFYKYFVKDLKVRTILLCDMPAYTFLKVRIANQVNLRHNLEKYIDGDIEMMRCEGFQKRFEEVTLPIPIL